MDLSKVLGDVYDTSGREATPASSGASAPEWADEAHLDEVFSRWTPGPPDEAPAAERDILGSAARIDDDLAEALSAALSTAGEPAAPEAPEHPVPAFTAGYRPSMRAVLDSPAFAAAAETAPVRSGWTRSDDDVLPGGGKAGRSTGFSLRRRRG